MTSKQIHLAIGLLLVLAVLGSIMRSQIPARIDLPFDLQSTTLAAEFAKFPDEVTDTLGSDRRYAKPIEQQQYWDFAFIPCYVALFIVLALALRNYDVPGARVLSWIAIAGAIAAGVCDIGENIAIIKIATAATPTVSSARTFAVPKWGLVFAVMTIESLVLFFWPRLKLWWRIAAVIVGALFLFTGATGVLFALLLAIRDIAGAAAWMTWALIALLVFLAAIEIRARVRA